MDTNTTVDVPNKTLESPVGNADGFLKYFQHDLVSGLLVFLIALPLCIGISVASGFPPLAGIFTAIVGSIVTTFISNSELTIKGPAAGLIVIVLGCVEAFGGDGATVGGWGANDIAAYRGALAVGVVAAVLQILFGVFRAGILGEFFPTSAVHGMLAAIGVIIIAKQIPPALGVKPELTLPDGTIEKISEPLELLAHVPHFLMEANPAIAAIGIVSLLIMFIWPIARKRLGPARYVPAPLVVLLVAIPMGLYLNLLHKHPYQFLNHTYELGENYLVDMPKRIFGMFDEVTTPDFKVLTTGIAWWWVFMFFMIGSLESLLSAKAVDLLDPWRRKTNMDRDIIAVGVANVTAAAIGGLPMISEIVRSRANIDNGARTRFADFWHGIFLLVCVAFLPMVLHLIPLAALAAMLVYTGSRLAHPTEFLNVYRIGREQFAIFVTTVIAVLATDLLLGIAIGIGVKFAIHFLNGVSPRSMFKPFLEVETVDESTCLIVARESAVFSNWIPFRRQIEQLGLVQRKNLIIDVSDTQLVDHSVMEKLEEMQGVFEQEGLSFEVRGLERMQPMANSAHAARKKGVAVLRRIIMTVPEEQVSLVCDGCVECGATSYTREPLERVELQGHLKVPVTMLAVRLEFVVSQSTARKMINFLRTEVLPQYNLEVCVEHIDKVEPDLAAVVRSSSAI